MRVCAQCGPGDGFLRAASLRKCTPIATPAQPRADPPLSLLRKGREGRLRNNLSAKQQASHDHNIMPTCDAQWDESRGGPRDAFNYISFPDDGIFYKATKPALPWTSPDHEDGRKIVPGVFIEGLFRRAPVPDWTKLIPEHFMTKCLDVDNYMVEALDLLIKEGLLAQAEDDGDEVLVEFNEMDDLYQASDKLVLALKDEPELAVGQRCLEWLEGFNGGPSDAPIAYFAKYSFGDLCKPTGDLTLYIALSFMTGARSTEASRLDRSASFFVLIGGNEGGQLMQAVKSFYYTGTHAGQPMDPAFLLTRLADFLADSQWPAPYDIYYPKLIDYAFDLPRRVAWKTAGRIEWGPLVQNKLPKVLRRSLPTLLLIFEDYLDEPAALVREIQSLGDYVLPGDDASKLVFWKILEVEQTLRRKFGDLVDTEVEGGTSSSALIEKLKDRLRAGRAEGRAQDSGGAGTSDELRGPKPSQVAKAAAEKDFTRLEVKYTPLLLAGRMTNVEKLTMFKEVLTSKTVLGHAVIFAWKGARLSLYIGAGGSEFLTLLYAERHLFAYYLGQSLAYDDDLGSVPAALKTFHYHPSQTALTCEVEWDALDPFNYCLLLMMGEEAGTQFVKYSIKNLYHDGDMLARLRELMSKKFESIGYPREVPIDEGMSVRQAYGRLIKLQKFALALEQEEQKAAYERVDYFKSGLTQHAADNFKRVVYGPRLAGARLGPWVRADEPIVIELIECDAAVTDAATFRRRLGVGIFGKKAQAASLPNLSPTSRRSARKPARMEAATATVPGEATAMRATTAAEAAEAVAAPTMGRRRARTSEEVRTSRHPRAVRRARRTAPARKAPPTWRRGS